jgi:hypothetical protein
MFFYNANRHNQTAADLGIFPNLIKDEYNNSAFWPVAMKPLNLYAAVELILQSRMENATYYYNYNTGQVSSRASLLFVVCLICCLPTS